MATERVVLEELADLLHDGVSAFLRVIMLRVGDRDSFNPLEEFSFVGICK